MAAEKNSLEELDENYIDRHMRDKIDLTGGPVEYTCRQNGYFVWNGVPLIFINDREKLGEIEDFQFGAEDVLVSSFPKSGCHFVSDVISDILISGGKITDYKQLYFLEIGKLFPSWRDTTPKVVISHLPWRLLPRQAREGNVKMIRMSRNLKDMVSSWYPFALKKIGVLEPGTTMDQFIDIVITGKLYYGNYFDWLKEWYPHLKDEYVINMQFEEMKCDLKSNVLKLSAYLHITLTDEQVDSIVEQNTFANRVQVEKSGFDKFFLRKGEVGTWKDELTDEQIKKLDDWISKSMEGFTEIDAKFHL